MRGIDSCHLKWGQGSGYRAKKEQKRKKKMAKKAVKVTDERITPRELKEQGVKTVLDKIRRSKGYFMTNTERDLSQSDFKNRILPHTQMLVAGGAKRRGYFSIEISGGASVHVDMLRKQINPFEKLEVLESMMPDTMFQTLVPGHQPLRLPALSGQRHPAHRPEFRGSMSMSGASSTSSIMSRT